MIRSLSNVWVTADGVREIASLEASGDGIDIPAIVQLAWLRTASRQPSSAEKQRAVAHISQAESVSEGLRDLLWALLNTKEFILN